MLELSEDIEKPILFGLKLYFVTSILALLDRHQDSDLSWKEILGLQVPCITQILFLHLCTAKSPDLSKFHVPNYMDVDFSTFILIITFLNAMTMISGICFTIKLFNKFEKPRLKEALIIIFFAYLSTLLYPLQITQNTIWYVFISFMSI